MMDPDSIYEKHLLTKFRFLQIIELQKSKLLIFFQNWKPRPFNLGFSLNVRILFRQFNPPYDLKASLRSACDDWFSFGNLFKDGVRSCNITIYELGLRYGKTITNKSI